MKTRRQHLCRTFGFTLIELLVAATILSILAAIGLVSFNSANVRARDGKRRADLEQGRSALELYRSDIGYYPKSYSLSNASWNAVISIIGAAGYLNATTMTDPKNVAPYQYEYSSDASGKNYQVCATLEATEASYCLSNP